MKYIELFENDIGFSDTYSRNDSSENVIDKRKLSDTRKPRLMLKDINRLKKIREVRRLELIQQGKILNIMFSSDEEENSGF